MGWGAVGGKGEPSRGSHRTAEGRQCACNYQHTGCGGAATALREEALATAGSRARVHRHRGELPVRTAGSPSRQPQPLRPEKVPAITTPDLGLLPPILTSEGWHTLILLRPFVSRGRATL